MKVVILCGGQGTRMREETEYRPKPLVEIGGKPVLWHIMKLFATHGLREFVLCLGYRGNMIKDYFLNYEALNNDFTIRLGAKHQLEFHGAHTEQDYQVTLADTGLDAMTGARVARVTRYLGDDTFMVTYGDGVSNVDIPKLLAYHHAHGKLATMTVVHPISRFGIVDINTGGQVTDFAEKPRADGWMNAGFFVFNRKVLDYLSTEPECILERDPLEKLTADGQLMGFQHDGFFYAMDTYREYLYLNELWNSGEAPWAIWRSVYA